MGSPSRVVRATTEELEAIRALWIHSKSAEREDLEMWFAEWNLMNEDTTSANPGPMPKRIADAIPDFVTANGIEVEE